LNLGYAGCHYVARAALWADPIGGANTRRALGRIPVVERRPHGGDFPVERNEQPAPACAYVGGRALQDTKVPRSLDEPENATANEPEHRKPAFSPRSSLSRLPNAGREIRYSLFPMNTNGLRHGSTFPSTTIVSRNRGRLRRTRGMAIIIAIHFDSRFLRLLRSRSRTRYG